MSSDLILGWLLGLISSLSRSKFHTQTPRGATSALIEETTP
jgi:hypothetical protein